MSKGIDCAAKLTAQTAAAVRAAGYEFAGRYLVPNSGSLAWKALTKAEAEAITRAGLRLLTVYETTADRAKGGLSAGRSDGAKALACAKEIGMPERGIIYFAVDYDAGPGEFQTIADYLRGAREQTGPYEVGVYGSYRVIEDMAKRGACRGFWQCMAWSYGKISDGMHVYQGGYGQKVAGVSVDINQCANMDAAGIWDYSAPQAQPEREKENSVPAQTEGGNTESKEDTVDINRLLNEMTPAQAYEILKKAQEHAGTLPLPDWAQPELTEAKERGITDGTRPSAFVTRCESAIMALRSTKLRANQAEDDRK